MKLFLLKILFIKYRNSIFKYIINKNPNFEIDFFCHGWNIVLKDDIENIYKLDNKFNSIYLEKYFYSSEYSISPICIWK